MPAADDVRQRLDAKMEAASRALVAMDYLACERWSVEALAEARAAEDWAYYARILLPLQESRRQRRMIAAEGTIRLGAAGLDGHPATWLERLNPGCIVLTHPRTPDEARQLQQAAREQRRHVEVLYAARGEQAWTVQTFEGPRATATMPAPPPETTDRWLSDPADGRRQDASRWFMEATEKLGDALIASVADAEGTPQRVDALERALAGMTDHEKLHQRLAEAASALVPGRRPARRGNGYAAVPSPARRGVRLTRILGLTLLVGVVFLTILALVAWRLWSLRPEHWTQNQQAMAMYDAQQLEDMAIRVEQRVSNLVNGPLPATAEQTLQLSFSEVNAWLSQRAGPWLEFHGHRPHPAIASAMVENAGDQLVLAFRAGEDPEQGQVVSVYVQAAFSESADATVRVTKVLAGRLPVPAGWIVDRLRGRGTPDQPEALDRVAALLDGYAFDPLIVTDDRRIRVLDAAVHDEGVTLRLHIQPR